MTAYTTLTGLSEKAQIKGITYGRRQQIKTLWISVPLDLIIPFTFGMISLGMNKAFDKVLFWIPLKEKGIVWQNIVMRD